jgi:hypothetical protein
MIRSPMTNDLRRATVVRIRRTPQRKKYNTFSEMPHALPRRPATRERRRQSCADVATFSLAGRVPEPGTLLLMGAGMTALWWRRKRND